MTDATRSKFAGALPAGMDETAFVEAVAASGYPLQAVVAKHLEGRDLQVTEEWAYLDPDTEQRRTIDVLGEWRAARAIPKTESGSSALSLVLIIECKLTTHPYVFFESVSPPRLSHFPPIVGLGDALVRVRTTKRDNQFWEVPAQRFLGLNGHELITTPPTVSSLSKATPNGKKVKLSGDEPFNSLLLPLTKATARYREAFQKTRERGARHEVRVPLAVAVIEGPMVLADKEGPEPGLHSTQWVRAVVHRPTTASANFRRRVPRFDLIDIVSCDFLPTYLDQFAIPYGELLWRRHAEHHEPMLRGSAMIEADLDEPLPDDLLSRLV